MEIRLISNDRRVRRLCREIVAELPNAELLPLAELPVETENNGLYIWDLTEISPVALPDAGEIQSHIFLVHRKDLAGVVERFPKAAFRTLLKPVNKAALRAFLENALIWRQARSSESVRSLRASRNDILQCLLEANLKLQEHDERRTNFLARMLHDFRVPLTAIDGYCSLLLGPLGPRTPEQAEVLRRMQQAVGRLTRISTAMFQLSVAPQQEVQASSHPASMETCLDQALLQVMPMMLEKNIDVDVQLEPPGNTLFFESDQIEQVLVNLLENACKFAPRGSSIQILGYRFDNGYRVDVQDRGRGIPPEGLGEIFEEYTSYSGSEDRSGGGLALAISKMILTAHQGRIWAESGKNGTTFSFVLPFEEKVQRGSCPDPAAAAAS